MKISSISLYNNNVRYNNVQNKQRLNNDSTVSFGMAKPDRRGLMLLNKLGAKPINDIEEKYFNPGNNLVLLLHNVNASSLYSEKYERLKDFSDIVKFYGTSDTLPASCKADFIKNQVLGKFGKNIKEIKSEGKTLFMDKTLNDEFRNTMVDLYIHGASYNRELDLKHTKQLFDAVKEYMTSEEEAYCTAALAHSK